MKLRLSKENQFYLINITEIWWYTFIVKTVIKRYILFKRISQIKMGTNKITAEKICN